MSSEEFDPTTFDPRTATLKEVRAAQEYAKLRNLAELLVPNIHNTMLAENLRKNADRQVGFPTLASNAYYAALALAEEIIKNRPSFSSG